MQWPLAVTLTSPNTPTIPGMIRKFRKALQRFRRSKFWGPHIQGGVLGIEVTNIGSGWHVHAHLLIDCRWLALATSAPRTSDSKKTVQQKLKSAHNELSVAWAKCLHEPLAVVWVERAWGKALLETVKYTIKPADLLAIDEPIAPLIREMHRLQLVNGFGSCYGLTKKWKAEEKANKHESICPECNRAAHYQIAPHANHDAYSTHNLRRNVRI